ncbi:MAG: dethiobiotin synthase [Acidobacteriota bacterium]|nr:dethiobiotin synthase [Acidobacteriota bacterium]MDH3529932.1 dethiobiotin synthase [Acidobacteriota bacterium]
MKIERGIFVTGTGTGVGKTVVSALLVATLRKQSPVVYWKPVQTGIERDCDTSAVKALAGCDPSEIHEAGIRLKRPLSPHLAARLEGVSITVKDITDLAENGPKTEFWIVEGAGGVLVPLNENELMIDLIIELGLPSIVVSSTGLGTINHSLLTIDCIRSRGGEVAGVVMNGEPNRENSSAISDYGKVTILAEVPVLRPLTAGAIAKAAGKMDFGLI